LRGIYFAESVRMPEKSTWFREFHDQAGCPTAKRKDELYLMISSSDLKPNANYDFTVAVDPRPKIKADGRLVGDITKIQVQFLMTKVKARQRISMEFEIPVKEGGDQKEGKVKDAKAEKKKEKARTIEKIFHPPKFPWEDWNIGLTLKEDTNEVEEAIGQSNEIRPGWRLVKINTTEVSNANIKAILKKLEDICAKSPDVKRLEALKESKHRDV